MGEIGPTRPPSRSHRAISSAVSGIARARQTSACFPPTRGAGPSQSTTPSGTPAGVTQTGSGVQAERTTQAQTNPIRVPAVLIPYFATGARFSSFSFARTSAGVITRAPRFSMIVAARSTN